MDRTDAVLGLLVAVLAAVWYGTHRPDRVSNAEASRAVLDLEAARQAADRGEPGAAARLRAARRRFREVVRRSLHGR